MNPVAGENGRSAGYRLKTHTLCSKRFDVAQTPANIPPQPATGSRPLYYTVRSVLCQTTKDPISQAFFLVNLSWPEAAAVPCWWPWGPFASAWIKGCLQQPHHPINILKLNSKVSICKSYVWLSPPLLIPVNWGLTINSRNTAADVLHVRPVWKCLNCLWGGGRRVQR